MFTHRLVAVVAFLLVVSVNHASPPSPTVSAMPPWLRLLKGEDKKKAQAVAGAAYKSNAELVAAHEELLALRTREQGAEHHETISERWLVHRLRILAVLPEEKRRAWSQSRGNLELADRLEASGRFREALAHRREDASVCAELLGEEHPETATSYQNLAFCLKDQGQVREAVPLCLKALEIKRRTLGENHPETADGYGSLASCLKSLGMMSEALPLFQKALQIDRKTLGENDLRTAGDCNNLAGCLQAQGKSASALPLFQKALGIWRRTLGEDHYNTTLGYNNMAYCLQSQGKSSAALAYFRKALEIRKRTLGENHPQTALSYNNVAYCLQSQDKSSAALPLYRKSLEVSKQVLGENHPRTITIQSNVALCLQSQGELSEAMALHQKAVENCRRTLGENHPQTALIYNNLASCFQAQENWSAALSLYQKAVRIKEQFLGAYHPETAAGYLNLGGCLLVLGRPSEAADYFEKALLGFEYGRLSASDTGLERSLFGAGGLSPRAALAATLVQLGKPADAWRHAESDLGRGLLDQLTGRPSLSGEEQGKLVRSRSLDAQLLPLLVREKLTDEQRRQRNSLGAERDQLQEQLAAAAVRQARDRVLPLERVQASIPSDAALVFWIDNFRSMQHLGCVVRSTGEPHWVALAGTGGNDAWTEEDLHLPERTRRALAEDGARAATESLCKQLARQRLAPLEPYLQGVRHLYVVPAGLLAALPMASLTEKYTISYVPSGTHLARMAEQPPPTGSPRLLALGDPSFADPRGSQAAVVLPEHGLLIAQLQPGGNAQQVGLRRGDVLLAYDGKKLVTPNSLQTRNDGRHATVEVWRDGKVLSVDAAPGPLGITVDKRPAREVLAARRESDHLLSGGGEGELLPALPGTRREVESLAALFGKHDIFTGGDASEDRLGTLVSEQKLGEYTHLHFATHGKGNNDKAFESSLYLAQDDLPDNADRVTRGLKPIDGRLTAREVLDTWKLDADLVVLSACESGLGKQGGGDGLLGFAQAFLTAGSRSVVLSLWQVDDTATALLMRRFYQNLLGKRDGLTAPMGKAAALQEARVWLRDLTTAEADAAEKSLPRGTVRTKPAAGSSSSKPYAHPHYWSAFVLIGDPN